MSTTILFESQDQYGRCSKGIRLRNDLEFSLCATSLMIPILHLNGYRQLAMYIYFFKHEIPLMINIMMSQRPLKAIIATMKVLVANLERHLGYTRLTCQPLQKLKCNFKQK